MLSERSEHEPDEYDPEEEFRDPMSDSLTIPTVGTAEADVPPDLLRTFWIVVVVINAAVLAVSLGLMFLAFRGDGRNGVVLLVGGFVLFGLAVRRYRSYRTAEEGDADAADGDAALEAAPGFASGSDEHESAPETVSGSDPEADSPEDTERE